MCPVVQFASLFRRRIWRTVTSFSLASTINTYDLGVGTHYITAEFLRWTMRSPCNLAGGTQEFGFAPTKIGTRSIRSSAAMSLFLANHSVAKIMILGRWSSDAFLVYYLRPQVLEWTNNMSADMLQNESFFDATDAHRALPSDPRIRQSRRFNAVSTVPKQASREKINPHS